MGRVHPRHRRKAPAARKWARWANRHAARQRGVHRVERRPHRHLRLKPSCARSSPGSTASSARGSPKPWSPRATRCSASRDREREPRRGSPDSGVTSVRPADLAPIIAQANPDRVFHLASLNNIKDSFADPQADDRHQRGGLSALFDAVRAVAPGASLVSVGSSSEYGRTASQVPPLAEEHAPLADEPLWHQQGQPRAICAGLRRCLPLAVDPRTPLRGHRAQEDPRRAQRLLSQRGSARTRRNRPLRDRKLELGARLHRRPRLRPRAHLDLGKGRTGGRLQLVQW